MRGSDFLFDYFDFLYYKFLKVTLNCGGLYINYPKWLEHKKTTINPKNNDNKCFQYAVAAAKILNKLKVTQKEYQILNLLLISAIGKK